MSDALIATSSEAPQSPAEAYDPTRKQKSADKTARIPIKIWRL